MCILVKLCQMDHPVEHLKGYADGVVLFKKTRMDNVK